MKSKFIAVALAAALAGCASVDFQRYEGRDGSDVVEGRGGTKEVIEGLDVWGSGEPPRRYKVLGMVRIEDTDNFLGRKRVREALVKSAKDASADAAIALDENGGGQFTAIGFNARGGVTTGAGFGKKVQRWMLVKYESAN